MITVPRWRYRPPDRTPAAQLDRIFRPPGYVLLAEAVDILGKERFGDAWTGTETRARKLPGAEKAEGLDHSVLLWSEDDVITAMPSHPPSWRVLTEIGEVRTESKEAADARWREARPRLVEQYKNELAAWRRYDEILRLLREQLYVGSLLAFAHRPQIGDLWPIPVHVWGRDGIERVFSLGSHLLQWRDTNEIEFTESVGKISGRVVIARDQLIGARAAAPGPMLAPRTSPIIQGSLNANAPLSAETPPAIVPADKNTGGRPPRYDWDAFIREMMRLANQPDGLPDRAALTKIMVGWCMEAWGSAPADSVTRDRIARWYPDK